MEMRSLGTLLYWKRYREAYEEYSRHYCSGDGGHAGGRSRT